MTSVTNQVNRIEQNRMTYLMSKTWEVFAQSSKPEAHRVKNAQQTKNTVNNQSTIQNKHNMISNPNWKDTNQSVAIYKHEGRTELGSKWNKFKCSKSVGPVNCDNKSVSFIQVLKNLPCTWCKIVLAFRAFSVTALSEFSESSKWGGK